MDKLFAHVFLLILLVTNTSLYASPKLKEKITAGLATIYTATTSLIMGYRLHHPTQIKPTNPPAHSDELRIRQRQEWKGLHSFIYKEDYSQKEWALYKYLKGRTHINTGFYSIGFDKCKRDLKLNENSLVDILKSTNRKLKRIDNRLTINDFTYTSETDKSYRFLGFDIRKDHYSQDAEAGINKIEDAIKRSVYN